MARGSKQKYTEKQKRKAEHIEEGFRRRGLSNPEGRAWAVVNAIHRGGEKPGGGGYGEPENRRVYKKGGRRGGQAAARRPKAARKAAARKAAQTRARRSRA